MRNPLATNGTRVTNVHEIGRAELGAWQQFVDSRPDSGAMHHAGWYGVLSDASSVEPRFLVASDSLGRISGVMPGYITHSRLAGSHYTTLDGGPLAVDNVTADGLISHAQCFIGKYKLRYAQIRGHCAADGAQQIVATVHTLTKTNAGPDSIWNALKSNTRRKVRQAARSDLKVAADLEISRNSLAAFYALYAEHMHDLGTPVFGDSMFFAMRKHLGSGRLRLYMLSHRDSYIGGMLCVIHGNSWTVLYTIVRHNSAPDYANYLLYWHVLNDAASLGIYAVDWGRSAPGSTVHQFKQKWAATDQEVQYAFYASTRSKRARFGLVNGNREKGTLQNVWSRLPLSLCNALGPVLRRDLPFL